MINNNRIVPIEKVDLLSMYGLILLQNSNNSSMTALQASTIDGDFVIASTGIKLAAQPVKSANFTAASGTLYFVADYAYEGFSINGVAEEAADGSDDVAADGYTLYKAVLSSGDITITKVGF